MIRYMNLVCPLHIIYGVIGNDLIIKDNSGILLTGSFINYTFKGVVGTNMGAGDALFDITGGTLAPVFDAQGGIFHLEFNLTPVLSASTFSSNFDGRVK